MARYWWLASLPTPLNLYNNAPWIVDLIILCGALMAAFSYATSIVFRRRGAAADGEAQGNDHPMARRMAIVLGLATGLLIEVKLLSVGATLLDYIGPIIWFLLLVVCIGFYQFMRAFTDTGSGGADMTLSIGIPALFFLLMSRKNRAAW